MYTDSEPWLETMSEHCIEWISLKGVLEEGRMVGRGVLPI